MMNVKDKFSTIHLRDPFRAPWTLNCDNFSKLSAMCDVIDSCRWEGGRYRQKKLTQFTEDAFKNNTKFSIAADTYLFIYHIFSMFFLRFSHRTLWKNFSDKPDSAMEETFTLILLMYSHQQKHSDYISCSNTI